MLKTIALITATTLAFAGHATAADLPAKAPYSSGYNWTGCSLGVQAGGGWAHNAWTIPQTATPSMRTPGWLVGGQAGCDYQVDAWVFGFEGQFSAADMNGSALINTTAAASTHINEIATGTTRIGYAIDRVLPYAKAGFAWVNSDKMSLSPINGPDGFTGGRGIFGWTAGAGIEVAFMPNWSWKIEYNHMDLGTNSYMISCSACGSVPSLPISVDQHIDTVVLGLNYRFH
jgi:outer membrane immunogenic protein